MINIKKLPLSTDEYVATCSIERILQDARLVLESGDALCRKTLAGVILATLDHVEISQSLADLNKLKKEALFCQRNGK